MFPHQLLPASSLNGRSARFIPLMPVPASSLPALPSSLRSVRQTQLFFEVWTKTVEKDRTTFWLPHLGQAGRAASCSATEVSCANFLPQSEQRYSYVGMPDPPTHVARFGLSVIPVKAGMEDVGTNGNPTENRLTCKCLLGRAFRPEQTITERISHVFLNCGSQVRVLPGTPR